MSDVDDFVPIRPEELTDERLVAGQLRALQAEVRSGFDRIDNHLDTMFVRVLGALDDHEVRIKRLESQLRRPVRRSTRRGRK